MFSVKQEHESSSLSADLGRSLRIVTFVGANVPELEGKQCVSRLIYEEGRCILGMYKIYNHLGRFIAWIRFL